MKSYSVLTILLGQSNPELYVFINSQNQESIQTKYWLNESSWTVLSVCETKALNFGKAYT